MANSKPTQPIGAAATAPASPDPQLVKLYTELPELSPSAQLDQRILTAARQAAPHTPSTGRWIWPASLAASLVICTTLVTQMAKVVNPSPVVPSPSLQASNANGSSDGSTAFAQIDASLAANKQTDPPAIGAVAVGTEVTTLPTQRSATPESAEFWWDQLRHHAHNADREGFLATWQVYQDHRYNTPLPEDLQRWMADNRVPLTLPTGG